MMSRVTRLTIAQEGRDKYLFPSRCGGMGKRFSAGAVNRPQVPKECLGAACERHGVSEKAMDRVTIRLQNCLVPEDRRRRGQRLF